MPLRKYLPKTEADSEREPPVFHWGWQMEMHAVRTASVFSGMIFVETMQELGSWTFLFLRCVVVAGSASPHPLYAFAGKGVSFVGGVNRNSAASLS